MAKNVSVSFKTNKDEIYYSIGKFVVEFENLLKDVKEILVEFLDQQSMFNETEYIESLISELDAMGLILKFQNLYGIRYKDNKQNLELIKKIFLRLKLIVEFRNALVHSPWKFYEDDTFANEIRKISKHIDSYMISNKFSKRAAKHTTYTSTISLEMIKIYINELTNMHAIFSKLSKYHTKESDIKISIRKNLLDKLDRDIEKVTPETLDDLWKDVVKFVSKNGN